MLPHRSRLIGLPFTTTDGLVGTVAEFAPGASGVDLRRPHAVAAALALLDGVLAMTLWVRGVRCCAPPCRAEPREAYGDGSCGWCRKVSVHMEGSIETGITPGA